jgi:hypothetical protein
MMVNSRLRDFRQESLLPAFAVIAIFGTMFKQLVIGIGALALVAGCDSSTDPSVEDVAGPYSALAFVTTVNSVNTDELSRGATLTLVLSPGGSVTGSLHIPADASSPTLDADMAGTWALSGRTVTFTQSADTFIRNMSFAFVNGTLNGDSVFGGTRVQLLLSR